LRLSLLLGHLCKPVVTALLLLKDGCLHHRLLLNERLKTLITPLLLGHHGLEYCGYVHSSGNLCCVGVS